MHPLHCAPVTLCTRCTVHPLHCAPVALYPRSSPTSKQHLTKLRRLTQHFAAFPLQICFPTNSRGGTCFPRVADVYCAKTISYLTIELVPNEVNVLIEGPRVHYEIGNRCVRCIFYIFKFSFAFTELISSSLYTLS